jgi:hypothetical protein
MNYDDNGYSEVYAKYLTNIINKGNIIEIDNHLYRPDLLEEYLKTKGF